MISQWPQSADLDLADRFPGWDVERRTDGLHAWLVGTDPPLVVRSEDEESLRDEIRSITLQPHS
jgi:hypothetical protein